MSYERSRSLGGGVGGRGRDANLSDSSSHQGGPNLRLAPLRWRGESLSGPGNRQPQHHHQHQHQQQQRLGRPPQFGPIVLPRLSMHQMQLELEYDAEESDNDSDRPMVPGWPGALERHQSLELDAAEEQRVMRQAHALCVFDDLPFPLAPQSPGGQEQQLPPSSPLIAALARFPTQRRWGRWRWRRPPDCTNVRVWEAVMMYERGLEQDPAQRCNRCRAGKGVSPQCVVPPEEVKGEEGLPAPFSPATASSFAYLFSPPSYSSPSSGFRPCSNCMYDGVGHICSASPSFAASAASISGGVASSIAAEATAAGAPSGTSSGADWEANGGDSEEVIDRIAVLEMIAKLKRPAGTIRDDGLPARARRIEVAALQIARAAREWGERLARE